jgi:hypothetical protein
MTGKFLAMTGKFLAMTGKFLAMTGKFLAMTENNWGLAPIHSLRAHLIRAKTRGLECTPAY